MSTNKASGKYIVVFKKSAGVDAKGSFKDNIKAAGGEIGHELGLINGFAATIPDSALANLMKDPQLDYIEPDGVVTIAAKNLGIGR